MTASKAAPRKRGAAARSEVNGKATTIELQHAVFKGLVLEGPKVLPATFSWDIAELGEARDEITAMRMSRRLIVSVVGEDQADRIRDRIAEKSPAVKDGGAELFSTILTDILNSYGTNEGESSASA